MKLAVWGGVGLVNFLLLGASWSLNSSCLPFRALAAEDLSSFATGEAWEMTLLSDREDFESLRAGSLGVEASYSDEVRFGFSWKAI